MKAFHKNNEPSYIQYWDVNNLYGQTISQKLPGNNFEWPKDTSTFNDDFRKNYNGESDKGYFLEADVQDVKKLRGIHNDLLFLPKGMKNEKVEQLVANLHYKTEIVIRIRNLQKSIKSWICFEKKL